MKFNFSININIGWRAITYTAMGFFQRVFEKPMRLRKDVADDYRSLRRFYEKSPEEFLHEAIPFGRENSPLAMHTRSLVNGGRLTGINVVVKIGAEDWLALQEWREDARRQLKLALRKLDEEDELIQIAIECYAKHEKSKKGIS